MYIVEESYHQLLHSFGLRGGSWVTQDLGVPFGVLCIHSFGGYIGYGISLVGLQ